MSHMDVIWDEELLQSFYTQDGLLQHVSRSVEYLFAEERKPSAELKIHGKPHHINAPSFNLDLAMHAVQEELEQSDVEMVDLMQCKQVVWDNELLNEQQEAGFDECLVVDTKATFDLVINDLLTTDSDMDTADNLFNDTSIEVVVWDEEKQHMFEHHGLLKQLAQGGNYFVGEEKKLTAAPPTYDVLTHVMTSNADAQEVFASISVANGLSLFLEHSVASMDQLSSEIPSEVVWDEECLYSMNSRGLLRHIALIADYQISEERKPTTQQLNSDILTQDSGIHALDLGVNARSDREATSLTDEGAFHRCKVSKCAAAKVFNKITLADVVWDTESQHSSKSHGLLLQLSSGEEYLDEETMCKLPLVDSDACQLFHKMPQLDTVWDDDPNYGTEPMNVKVAGLSFHEPDTEVSNVISIPYAFSLGNIFHLRNTDNIQVSLIKQSYCDLANFGMLVWQQDAILVGHQPELGMDLVDTVFDETPPEMFVWAAGFLPDACGAHGLFNRMLYQDVLWDDDPELDDLMQGKLLSEEVICDSMVWDEIQAEIGMHHGLLQRQVTGATNMENGIQLIVKLIKDEMLPVIGIFQLLQEHGIEVADQRLEQLHLQIVDFKAQMLSGCESHKHVTQLGEYLVDADIKPMAEHITIDRDTPFLLVICMDLVDVLQVEEHVDFGMALRSAGGMQGIGGAQYVIYGRPPWRRSTFSLENDDMTIAPFVFHHIPPWNSNDFSPWTSTWFSIVGLQLFQHCDHSNHQATVVSKYDIERMLCSECLIVPWDPGGNHDCFVAAIAWGQAMFCGGGNVIPRIRGYMGLNIMGFRPYSFVLVTMSGGYIGEKLETERGKKIFRN